MKVRILDEAQEKFDSISNYILTHNGERSKAKFVSEVLDNIDRLETNPYMGKIEPNLVEKASTYRSVVINPLNKVVYRILKEDILEIVAIWDVRRSPENLAKSIEENNQ